MKKLKLNKERIAQLSSNESAGINGGGSTEHKFTCGWCTGGGGSHTSNGASTCNCSTPEQGSGCPPEHYE